MDQFAEALNMSRIQLYRKLKALTDPSPTDFVRTLYLRLRNCWPPMPATWPPWPTSGLQ